MGPAAILNVPPSHRHQVLPDAVPRARAREDRKVSGTSAIPCHGAAGARGRVRHDRLGGREFLACHPRTSPGARGARGRWGGEGGVPIPRAHPREMTPVAGAKPCGRAGALARLPPKDAVAGWNPAPHARQEALGEMRWRLMARPLGLIPIWVARPGHPHGARPGPAGKGQLDPHREHAPLVPPSRRRRAGGRAPALAMAPRAEDVGARACCERLIAGQHHRSHRDHRGQQTGQPPASQLPCRPASPRKHPVRGGNLPLGVRTHTTADSGDGPATRRSYGPAQPHEAPVRRWGGNSRLQ